MRPTGREARPPRRASSIGSGMPSRLLATRENGPLLTSRRWDRDGPTNGYHGFSLSGTFEQERVDHLADGLLALLPGEVELAFPAVADDTPSIDHVDRRPVAVVPGLPVRPVVVDGDGELQSMLDRLRLDPIHVALARSLGRVDADDHHVLACVSLLPSLVMMVVVHAIITPNGPEVDQYDLAAELGHCQWV